MTLSSSRVVNYWTERAHDFNTVRKNELRDDMSRRWLSEICRRLPDRSGLSILDVGTGTGYFAILLSEAGYNVTGIDLTEAMLEEAKKTASEFHTEPIFLKMDAQHTTFASESFDVILTRNLTWTLPDPAGAYQEWYRLLKKGGILMNFDANYADNVRHHRQRDSYISPSDVYGHCGITPSLQTENDEITLSMPCSLHHRPDWDLAVLKEAGFASCGADETLGRRILKEHDLADAPLFLVWAEKGE